jgi:NAD(P)-dependent dehydrogenase (short-subunit alcohol dehydrogenase family)
VTSPPYANRPAQVACTVAFLAMGAAGYITGQVVGVDGGMMQEGFRYTGEL